MTAISIGLLALCVVGLLAVGWLVPLILGIIRRVNRKSYGGLLIGIGSVWGVLVLVGIGYTVFNAFKTADEMDFLTAKVFDPSTHKGPTGRLVIPYKGQASLTTTLDGEKKPLKYNFRDGAAVLPAGKHKLEYFEARAQDKNGLWWSTSCMFIREDEREITVQAAKDTATVMGPPYTASVVVDNAASGELSLKFTSDNAGYGIGKENGDDVKTGFQILGQSGKVLYQNDFEGG